MRAVITGTGMYIPPIEVDNDQLTRIMETTDEWIRVRTGIERRCFAPEGTATSDLGLEAARVAIASAGLYNQKSTTLIRLADRVLEEYGSAEAFDAFVKDADPDEVRDALLDMKGVGPKTADCVLLFSGGRGGVFPVQKETSTTILIPA